MPQTKDAKYVWNGKRVPPSDQNIDQIISITDIISEGPIEGLVHGAASIYLDNTPAATKKQAGINLFHTGATFTTTTGNTAVAVSNLQEDLTSWTASTGIDKYLIIQNFRSADDISATLDANADVVTFNLTAASAFFYSWMIHDSNVANQASYITLYLSGQKKLEARISSITDTTHAKCIAVGGTKPWDWQDRTSAPKYTIGLTIPLKLASISANSVTLDSGTNIVAGDFRGNISDSIPTTTYVDDGGVTDTSQVDGFLYSMRNGTLYQPPLDDLYEGNGATSITTSFNQNLEYPDGGLDDNDNELYTTWPLIDDGVTRYIKNSADMSLTSSTVGQVDAVKMVFAYPAGLISKGTDSVYQGLAVYKIEFAFDYGGGFGDPIDWKVQTKWGNDYTFHKARTSSNFFVMENISLHKYKPFKDFKFRVTRAIRDDVGARAAFNYDYNNSVTLNSVLSSVTCIIRERLNYPYTACIQTRCNASQFKNIPKRSYECKGRLIQIPSNYITRDQSSNGIANYRRNSSTGLEHATDDQDWDGSFRKNIYTDNPAWVFYDIVTNDRYGLGAWINTTDIDKYALYRIAKYCDELVPDGKGGTEPRFTANIYLSKATEAYKVLKDMATTFRAILFWSEGNIMPVVDQAKDPIYNFTKGNVIDGKFQYEGTGSKLRSNQVAVTWNNPENDYVPEALLVEDKENIVKSGKIIIEEAVAFGATSIGQATRYGRWKLWTAINQQEVVSFKTSISGAFIGPGDIINIQDADRYDVAYSGRISNGTTSIVDGATSSSTSVEINATNSAIKVGWVVTGTGISGTVSVSEVDGTTVTLSSAQTLADGVTLTFGAISTSVIPLDREIVLTTNDTYELSVLIQEPAVFLGQDAATISGTGYVRGERIPGSYTEATASDIKDSVTKKVVQVIWAPYTHVESRIVDESVSTDTVTSLTVSETFDFTPDREAIWLLKATVDASKLEREGTKKMYKILGIVESKKNEFSITAVEHFNNKFDDVDKDFGRPYVDTMLEPGITVPAPTNVTSTVGWAT